MRVWDIEPERLCRRHLLAQHNEIHAIWAILTGDRKGYSRHPETLRWRGRTRALYERHRETAEEMTQRGYRHESELDESLASGEAVQTEFVDSPQRQAELLHEKDCDCDAS